jgi:hypothetical protein
VVVYFQGEIIPVVEDLYDCRDDWKHDAKKDAAYGELLFNCPGVLSVIHYYYLHKLVQ